MTKYDNFRKPGMVSIWVGNLSSDSELDNYLNLSRKFERDFGFKPADRDMPETTVKSSPVSIGDLVNGFSWSDSYRALTLDLADKQKIKQATTMVVFFNFEYQPERTTPEKISPLKYLGALHFGRDGFSL